MTVDFSECNPNHWELFQSTAPELIVYGGSGAGKSFSVADKFLMRSVFEPKTRYLIIRKTLPSLKDSCMYYLQLRAGVHGVPYEYHAMRGEETNVATVGNGCKFYFRSMNDYQARENLKGFTDIAGIWFEESNGITEDDYQFAFDRMRNGGGKYAQAVRTLNPTHKSNWNWTRNFAPNAAYPIDGEKIQAIRYTIESNPWHDKKVAERLRATKSTNPNYYNIYYLGEWGSLEGIIYPQMKFSELNYGNPLSTFDEVFAGLDFGHGGEIGISALVLIGRIADKYYAFNECYRSTRNNAEFLDFCEDKLSAMCDLEALKTNMVIWADSESPDKIYEWQERGWHCYGADKGAGSVVRGIEVVGSLDLTIGNDCPNMEREIKSYSWKQDRNGNSLPDPVKVADHLMDATRYALDMQARQRPATESESAGIIAIARENV